MQDGRRMLEPRATRTLLRVDGNERDVARTRGTSSGLEKEKEKERREREREEEEEKKKKEEERGSNTRTNEKKGDEDRKREMNNAWGRRGNT